LPSALVDRLVALAAKLVQAGGASPQPATPTGTRGALADETDDLAPLLEQIRAIFKVNAPKVRYTSQVDAWLRIGVWFLGKEDPAGFLVDGRDFTSNNDDPGDANGRRYPDDIVVDGTAEILDIAIHLNKDRGPWSRERVVQCVRSELEKIRRNFLLRAARAGDTRVAEITGAFDLMDAGLVGLLTADRRAAATPEGPLDIVKAVLDQFFPSKPEIGKSPDTKVRIEGFDYSPNLQRFYPKKILFPRIFFLAPAPLIMLQSVIGAINKQLETYFPEDALPERVQGAQQAVQDLQDKLRLAA